MVTGNKQAQNYGQGVPAPLQMEHPENDNPNSFSVNRPSDPSGSRLDNLDRTDQIGANYDAATMDNSWNDAGLLSDDSDSEMDGGLTQSARISQPANQASFDAQSHVQSTCGKPELISSADLIKWAIGNYTIDSIKISKNRWKIRLRCRKSGCQHADHLHLKTISKMSDSAYKKLTRLERKYELWKKATIAENARALRKSN